MNRRDFFKRTAAAAVVAPVVAKAAPAVVAPVVPPEFHSTSGLWTSYHGPLQTIWCVSGGFTSSALGLSPVEPHETAMTKADKARETRGETV